MYPPGGFTNFLQSNGSPENFHLVGNTTSRTTISPTAPSLKRTLESNAEDKETINIDAEHMWAVKIVVTIDLSIFVATFNLLFV